MVKVFNGRAATEEYMSTHSLTFSTPEMTLRKFALWLGEQVSLQGGTREPVPRLMMYIEEKADRSNPADFSPVVDDSFRPTGAVTDMYRGLDAQSASSDSTSPPRLVPLDRETLEPEVRYCINCGSQLKPGAKFCVKCGSSQTDSR